MSAGYTITIDGLSGNFVELTSGSTSGVYLKVGRFSTLKSPEVGDRYVLRDAWLNGTLSFSQLLSYYPSATLSYNDDFINNDVYNQLDRWLRDRVASNNNKLTLGVPHSKPYSNTGKPLTLGVDGSMYLDGVPYSAELQWGDVIQGLTDAGVLVVPDIMVNGNPVHLVQDAAGQTQLVDQTGVIVSNPSQAVSVPKQIVWVDGVPYVITPTGAMINIRTGEIVTDLSIPGVRDPVKPIVPPAGDIAAPSIGVNFDPLIMSAEALTRKFPFSVPWDVARQLSVFNVEAEAPKWDINVPNFLQIEGVNIPMQFTLDLSMFDVVATMIRWFNVLIWDIALLLALRRFMPE